MASERDVLALVNEQAEDEGLWFVAQTAPEGYLQQELRRLHRAIEAAPSPEPLPLDVERPEYLDWLDTIEDAFGSDPNYQDGPQRHTRAHEAMRKLRAALREPDRPT